MDLMINSTLLERKKTDCNALPKGWQREEISRKGGLSAGKVDVIYYSPSGKKIESKPQLARELAREQQQLPGEIIDVSTFDYQAGKSLSNSQQLLIQRSALKRKAVSLTAPNASSPTSTQSSSSTAAFRHQFDYSRGIRTDASLVPPIRQTASIFKQPVTIYKTQESKVKTDLKHGPQDKPKQLFWEKRLEGLRACDIDGMALSAIELPRGLKPCGPNVNEETLLQSIATALHVCTQSVTGQTASKTCLTSNCGVFLNPEQPLMHSYNIGEEDIKKQEDRVSSARKKLQDALKEE